MLKFVFLSGMLLLGLVSHAQPGIINIKKAGADASGQIKCTQLIAESIAQLVEQGGGEVFFPAGTYLTGPIEMKSNITLNIGEGAILKFTDDFDDYLPMVKSRWEGVRVNTFKSNIYAYDATNITIKGRGLIDGNGKKWWDMWWPIKAGAESNTKWDKLFREANDSVLAVNEYLQKMGTFLRPPLFMPYECSNVLVEGVTFQDPPFWTLMPVFSENITIDGITILNPADSPNTDGIDISSCINVRIANSHISVGDDCIVIKSGRDEDGRLANRPTENITITNCTMLDGHGGVVIGSEMSGSVRRVTISNCVFQGTDRGIRIKTMRGRGGVVEDVRVSNIVMYDIVKQGVMLNMHYHETPDEPVSERTPAIRNVFISDIRINKAKQAIAIYGLKERYAENITFTDFNITAEKGITGQYASGVSCRDFIVDIEKGPAFSFDQSVDLSFSGISSVGKDSGAPVMEFTKCEDVLIKDAWQVKPVKQFAKFDISSQRIYFINNVLPGALKTIEGKPLKLVETGTIKK